MQFHDIKQNIAKIIPDNYEFTSGNVVIPPLKAAKDLLIQHVNSFQGQVTNTTFDGLHFDQWKEMQKCYTDAKSHADKGNWTKKTATKYMECISNLHFHLILQ